MIDYSMINDIDGINRNIGKTMYLLIVDDILIGSTRKVDINKCLEDSRSIIGADDYDEDSTILLYGLVLDPQRLPYELPPKLSRNDVWTLERQPHVAIADMIGCSKNNDIEGAVNLIEKHISSDLTLSIEDFAIVVGREINFVLQIGPKQFEIDVKHLSL